MHLVRSLSPLSVAVFSLAVVCVLVGIAALRLCHGRFVYVLDDPYIHMAIARSVSESGVWGVTGHQFSSASSSPVWTLLIALAYRLVGIRDAIPFWLSLGCGAALLLSIDRFWVRDDISHGARVLGLLAVLFVTPVPALVFLGQEHLLHALLTVILADRVAGQLSDAAVSYRGPQIPVLVALLPLVRYEGLFLVAVLALFCLIRRRFALALQLAFPAAASLAAFGLFSTLQGGRFLPNSVLVKDPLPKLSILGETAQSLGGRAIRNLWETPYLVVLFLAVAAVLWSDPRASRSWSRRACFAAAFLGTLLLHLQFAAIGSFYRYEAYLVAMGLTASWASASERAPRLARALVRRHATHAVVAATSALLVMSLPLVVRAFRSVSRIPRAARNIYEQQYQMTEFLRDSFPGAVVALNDIGLTSYRADIDCVDLSGLADSRVLAARLEGSYNTQTIREIARARKARLAIVSESWFARFGGLPPEWVRVGQWTSSDNVVLGDATVSFLATNARDVELLRRALRRFAGRLPARVRQSGDYLAKESTGALHD